jgi:hypothetical protein
MSDNAETSKGMRVSQVKALLFGNTQFSNYSSPCQWNRRLPTMPAERHARRRKDSKELECSNSWQGERDLVVLSKTFYAICTEGWAQVVMGLWESQWAAGQPA